MSTPPTVEGGSSRDLAQTARDAHVSGEARHADGVAREPDYDPEKRLPDGLTCSDCAHGPRCDGLFGAVRRRFTSCDFWPSRFAALSNQKAQASGGGDE
jgi:hypothetical protein